MVAQLQEMGAPPERIAELQNQASEFEVDPDNWETVALFMQLQTQWRMGPAGATGLDYLAVEALFRILEVEDRQARFQDLRVMEAAALRENQKMG